MRTPWALDCCRFCFRSVSSLLCLVLLCVRAPVILGGGGVDPAHMSALAKAEADVAAARESLGVAEAELQATHKAWEAGLAVRKREIDELDQVALKLAKLQEEHKRFHTAINSSKNKIKELEKHVDNTREKQSGTHTTALQS